MLVKYESITGHFDAINLKTGGYLRVWNGYAKSY